MAEKSENVGKPVEEQIKEAVEAFAHKRAEGETFAVEGGGGSSIDADIADLQQQLNDLGAQVDEHEERLDDLEADDGGGDGGGTDPEPEPGPEPEPDDKLYPDENDPMTGIPAGVTLSNSGSITLSTPGQVVENKNINGTVSITAKGCKLRNCRITSGAYTIITARQDSTTEIDHCEIVGNGSGQNGFDGTGWVHHCRIIKCENPINIAGDDALIEWNDIHDMKGVSTSHIDGIQADGDIDGLIIRNNRLDNKNDDTSAVMLDNYWGAIKNVTVENNFLGGGSFPAYLDGQFNGSSNATNIIYRNNHMRKGGWGSYFYWQQAGSGCKREGNTDYQTGANVDNK